jgi:hypothetical protein
MAEERGYFTDDGSWDVAERLDEARAIAARLRAIIPQVVPRRGRTMTTPYLDLPKAAKSRPPIVAAILALAAIAAVWNIGTGVKGTERTP